MSSDVRYAVTLEPDDDAVRVILPAFPEINTFGDDERSALAMAWNAIELSISYRRKEGLEIPESDADIARIEAVAVTLPAT